VNIFIYIYINKYVCVYICIYTFENMNINVEFSPLHHTSRDLDDLTAETQNLSGQESVPSHPRNSRCRTLCQNLLSFYQKRPKCSYAIIFTAIAVSSLITFVLISVGPCHLKSSHSKPLTNFKLSWKRPFNVILFGDSLIRNPSRGYNLLGRIDVLLPQSNLNLIDMGEGGNKINDMLLRIEEVNI
jgi:hypothetical protein